MTTMLSKVRHAMQLASIKALIVPSSDPHNSEYVAEEFKHRANISGFHGSAGTCVLTDTKALLWTDGRYWTEAEKVFADAAATGCEWTLMRDGGTGVPSYEDWLEETVGTLPVGLDPFLTTISAWERMSKKINLVATAPTLIAGALGSGAAADKKMVYVRPSEFCGETCASKVERVANEVVRKKCDLLFVSALDDIAWLTNLRGADVPMNPVFYAYAVVDGRTKTVALFVDPLKIGADVKAAMPPCVSFFPYTDFASWVASCPADQSIGVDENQTSFGSYTTLKDHFKQVKRFNGIICAFKAIKNPTEIEGFRNCHIRDGCALTRFLAWIDNEVGALQHVVDEVGAADRLELFRREESHFVQLSFDTISGSGPNGAVIHYHPHKATCAAISPSALYLVDSGAQYYDGTTDVTRTLCFSAPTDFEKEAYTLVLKGHIAINSAIWPKNTTGHRIDALARMALWQKGLNYGHGTGHGVGSFLNVHEGPHGIGTRPPATGATLDLNMICSNEPGYYKPGSFGIRIETLEVVVPATTAYGGDEYLTFDQLTIAPLCLELIDTKLLRPDEVAWVNAYSEKTKRLLLPLLEAKKDTLAITYLEKHTSFLS